MLYGIIFRFILIPTKDVQPLNDVIMIGQNGVQKIHISYANLLL